MAASTIVMVLDLDDPKRGEMNVVNDPQDAERMVESLLESGLVQERIRVFSASALEVKVVNRPVVSFIDAAGQANGETQTPLVHSGINS